MALCNGHATLDEEDVATCLDVLTKLQNQQTPTALSNVEKYAIGHLQAWLAAVHSTGTDPREDQLDESGREYLESYKEKFSRPTLARNTRGLSLLPTLPRAQDGSGVSDDIISHQAYRSVSISSIAGAEYSPELAAALEALDDWDEFDIFRVAELSQGKPLQTVGLALFRRYGLLEKLELDEQRLANFLKEVELSYNPNPYHCGAHAADVAQTLGVMLSRDAFCRQLTDLEVLAMVTAALCHDVGHPGVSNAYLMNTQAPAALLYNDNSINENMHAALTFKILAKPGNNFLAGLAQDEFRFVRRAVIAIILATDMAGHTELTTDFTANMKLLGSDLGAWPADKRTCVLQMAVHCSDIGNPAKPLHLSQQWTQRVMQEFFAQGDKEREAGVPVSPLCDRGKVVVPKSQLTFLDYVVRPSYEALSDLAPNTAARALHHVEHARQHWIRLLGDNSPAEGAHPHQ